MAVTHVEHWTVSLLPDGRFAVRDHAGNFLRNARYDEWVLDMEQRIAQARSHT